VAARQCGNGPHGLLVSESRLLHARSHRPVVLKSGFRLPDRHHRKHDSSDSA
jgi:hypothetical protein